MTYILGLTGSIGMGKSTTAQIFRDFDIPVWDADACVHELYTKDNNAIAEVANAFPNALINGKIDRPALSDYFKTDRSRLKELDAIVHPLVAKKRAEFIQENANQDLIVLDIPLLFEVGRPKEISGVLVVTIDFEIQKSRVMMRPNMTEDWFEMVLSKQIPDAEKQTKADFVIETKSIDHVRSEVKKIIEKVGNA